MSWTNLTSKDPRPNLEHSPLPWRVEAPASDLFILAADGGRVAIVHRKTGQTKPTVEEALANAERLVRAVNEHDELLAACRDAYTVLIGRLGPHHAVTEQVGRAVAKAKGRS